MVQLENKIMQKKWIAKHTFIQLWISLKYTICNKQSDKNAPLIYA